MKEHVKRKKIARIQSSYTRGWVITQCIKQNKKFDFDAPGVKPEYKLTLGATKSEEKAIDLIYEKEIEQWLERKNMFELNWTKAYATIFHSFCSSAMQGELRELPNFESDIEDDPLKLLDNV